MPYQGDNLMSVKRSNRSAALRILHDRGAMSRKRLAENLNLTPAAITKIVAEMISDGLLREGETVSSGGAGRRQAKESGPGSRKSGDQSASAAAQAGSMTGLAQTGRIIYDSMDKLASVLRVKKIVSVPVMENKTRTVSGATRTLMGIIVNPADYNMGADKGGAVSMFDDFDIDYNRQKYLIETRCSGALTVPYSAIAVEQVTTAG